MGVPPPPGNNGDPYDLQAQSDNGVIVATSVEALSTFNIPQAPPNTTPPIPPPEAIWVVDGSAVPKPNWPATGPVDGILSKAGPGGAKGVIGQGAEDGNGVGVFGWGDGGGPDGNGTGVLGAGLNGVVGQTGNPTGVAVIGQSSGGIEGGTAIVGWAVSPPPGTPELGSPVVTPLTLSAGGTVGVYGCVSDDVSPSVENVQSGVWGEARNSEENATGIGVFGTSQQGQGVVGNSIAANGVVGESQSPAASGVWGNNTGGGTGVAGSSTTGVGVGGSSTGGNAVTGQCASPTASGVWGNNTGGGTGVAGSSTTGVGVGGSSTSGTGGVFQSQTGAPLQLMPSSTPLQDSPVFESGQTGDLYLYSVVSEVNRAGTSIYETILWLCISPAVTGQTAIWAQVQLGDIAASS